MIQEEIQNWIYEIKEVDALSAKALLRVYEQLGLSAAADRLGAISSEQTNVEYASVWLWAVDRNPERRESLNKIREELTAKYCSENSKDVHLTGQQVFYELSFFTEYETKYGTLQYYENIYRQLCQVEKTQRDGWYLYGFFSGAGCELSMNEDNTNNCDWNSATGLAVAESVENIASSKAFVNVADQDAITMLNDGTLSAYVSGTWNASSFEEKYGDGYAATKLPTFDVNGTATQMKSYAGYKFVGVNSHAENVGWSMLLAEYLTNEESQLAIGNATQEGPANTVAAEQISSPALAALAAQSAYADQQIVGQNYWDPAKALGQNLVDGASDLQKILDDAVTGITQPIAE